MGHGKMVKPTAQWPCAKHMFFESNFWANRGHAGQQTGKTDGQHKLLPFLPHQSRAGICTAYSCGAWRSLVAHLLWEQGVEGSNPFAPTR